jgi:hypothetical protein
MTQEEIDIIWQQAMQESIKDGEMFTRYHFAKLVAAKEREACAKVCEGLTPEWPYQSGIAQAERTTMLDCAAAIRARGQA